MKPYLRSSDARKSARKLDKTAFCKAAVDSLKAHRCQILIERNNTPYLVASGPTWGDALEMYFKNIESVHEMEAGNGLEEEATR